LGAFLAHPVIRRAICEPAQPLRFRQIMDRGEIVIVNLAKGRIGSDMANVLGGLITSTVMHAAFSRHGSDEKARRPFMLYVDEFPSFTTEAFANLLPESRKYGLGLVLAHQHVSQMTSTVFDAVVGNAGTIIAFRVGANDASTIARQLDIVDGRNLITLPNHRAMVQLMMDGRKTPAFSARTWPLAI
jgi:type IV secretory pathway TraG/TraD family ATPase VirD4